MVRVRDDSQRGAVVRQPPRRAVGPALSADDMLVALRAAKKTLSLARAAVLRARVNAALTT
jgi:hypothetical protein